MSLRYWRFAALLLTALTLGLGFCHVMELPARMTWDQSLWVGSTVTGGLYRMFGTLGAIIDLGAIACSIVVAVKTRGTAAFNLSALNAAMFVLALALWFAIVFPVNLELATWVNGPVPADWTRYRLRWETGHAINTALQLIGFCALLWSALRETSPRS
jgi:hypothetical protein